MWSGRCRCCCCCSNQKHCSQLTVKSGESHTLRTRFAVHSDPCQRCDGYPRRAAEPMSFRVPETALEQLAIGWSSSNNNNTMLLCATGPPSPLPYFFSTLTGLWKRKNRRGRCQRVRERARLSGRLPAWSKGSVAMASALFGAGVCQAVRSSAVSTHGGRNLEHTTRRRLKQHRVGMSRYVLLLARTMYAPSSMARSRAQLDMHLQVRVGGKTCSALGPRSDLPFSIDCQLPPRASRRRGPWRGAGSHWLGEATSARNV